MPTIDLVVRNAALPDAYGQAVAENKLGDKAREIYNMLSKKFMVDYDDSGAIGKRYRRHDEIGTPMCITVDFDTLEDNTVTVRDRDTMEQIRMPIDQLIAHIEQECDF